MPRVTIVAERSSSVQAEDPTVESYANRVVDILDVPGVAVSIEARLPSHVGLGSGTKIALSVLTATATVYDLEPKVRERAPLLGRGGRSGVGVATFEAPGFVVDAGHPTKRFTVDPPAEGDWSVPSVIVRHEVPADWRFLLLVPSFEVGRSGDAEDDSIRKLVERADPGLADDIAGILTRRLLPAIVTGRLQAFGDALTDIGRKNGAWYTEVQGGLYRPPAGKLVDTLDSCPALVGIGQSSWGPTVYGVTDERHMREARAAATRALKENDVDGDVIVTGPATSGVQIVR